MKRLVIATLLVVSLCVTPGHAGSQLITRTSFDASATGCGGTVVMVEYENCGPALLPVTDGTSTASQSAYSSGSYAVEDFATGGTFVEAHRAKSDIALRTSYISDAPLKAADVFVVFTVVGGEVTIKNQGGANFSGGTFIYSLATAGSRGPTGLDADCDDGTAIQAQGQTGGIKFDVTTPPGVYTLHIHYTCGGGGDIKPGQSFGAEIEAEGYTFTENSVDQAYARFSGSLDRVTFTLTS